MSTARDGRAAAEAQNPTRAGVFHRDDVTTASAGEYKYKDVPRRSTRGEERRTGKSDDEIATRRCHRARRDLRTLKRWMMAS